MIFRNAPDFAPVLEALAALPEPYRRTLSMRVELFDASSCLDSIGTILEYARWLGLSSSSLSVLRRVTPTEAHALCEICCSYDIAYEELRPLYQSAVVLGKLWAQVWGQEVEFFSNVPPAADLASAAVLRLAATPALFRDDIVLGVVAVQPGQIGLLFYHSCS